MSEDEEATPCYRCGGKHVGPCPMDQPKPNPAPSPTPPKRGWWW